MVLPIYFSHGYRPREAAFNEYFALLLRQIDFLPSLDPPSNDVNSAKLERHLSYTSGLISILTSRGKGTASPYLLYEINLSMRTRKPTIVFVEDTLPDSIVPPNILQKRFSARSYFRQFSEHLHSLEVFKTYIGDKAIPKYYSLTQQRTAILLGVEKFGDEYANGIRDLLIDRGYRLVELDPKFHQAYLLGEEHFEISGSYLVICNVDNLTVKNSYLLGTVQAIQTPTILLSQDDNSPLVDWVPGEFQRRIIPKKNIEEGLKIVEAQIELFEEDFIELDKDKKVSNYVNSLSLSAATKGEYSQSLRSQIIQITMGNKIENVTGSTIVVDSYVSNSFNSIASKYDEETAAAFKLLTEEVKKSNNAAASTLLTGLTEEVQKEKPEKGKLKQFWDGLVSMLPGITSMVGITEKIIKLFI